MKRFLLDTNVAGLLLDQREGILERAMEETAQGNPIGICHPVLAELVFGIENSKSKEKNFQRLQKALSILRIWPTTKEACFEYGRIAAELKRSGTLIQQNDIMIAAIALTLGNCVVVSRDSDLTRVPGLTVQQWAPPDNE